MIDIISLTGDIGSGKSHVARLLSALTNFEITSTGSIQRKIAIERKLTPLQLNELCMTDPSVDEYIDSYLKSLNLTGTRLIVDSRLAWFFIPRSFKVFLTVDPLMSAKRILSASRFEETHISEEDALRNNLKRKELENTRFLDVYGADCGNLNNYDFIIDTTYLDPETIARTIFEAFLAASQHYEYPKVQISPKRLYPTKQLSAEVREYVQELSETMRSSGYINEYAVQVIPYKHFYYIFDGHRRISAALKAQVHLIPVILLNPASYPKDSRIDYVQFIRAAVQPTILREWENLHGFKFLIYPDQHFEAVYPE